MKRRQVLQTIGAAGLLGLAGARQQRAQETAAKAAHGMPAPKIKDIQVIECQPAGVRLTVVKILTDQDGLYGYGCATFTQRADLVKPAVERYLKPFLLGKTTDRIEDIWQSCYDSSYWKNGPVLNNALSGIDQALWDIKGRQAGMPVYQLAGGKCREAADDLRACRWRRLPQRGGVREALHGAGLPQWCACRWACRAWPVTAAGGGRGETAVKALHDKPVFEPAVYVRRALKLFEVCRKELGDEVELLHDVHERVSPNQAVQFCKDAEKFKMFFLEDPLSPEDIAYFRQIRQNCATPVAMGELFNSPHEWQPLICRAPDRLHPRPRVADGRIHAGAQDRHPGRELRSEDRLARSRRCLAGGSHGQRDARPGELQLRDPGVLAVQRSHQGNLPWLPGMERWIPVGQREARMGYRNRRAGRRQSAVHGGPR